MQIRQKGNSTKTLTVGRPSSGCKMKKPHVVPPLWCPCCASPSLTPTAHSSGVIVKNCLKAELYYSDSVTDRQTNGVGRISWIYSTLKAVGAENNSPPEKKSPLLALFCVLPVGLSLLSYFVELVAFLKLLARCAILLRWKSPCPLFCPQWINDALHFMKLDQIKYSLRFSERTFHKIWQPFLDHVRSLQIDIDPDV